MRCILKDHIIYQVSTLQALAMGYTKAVITVKDLLDHGDIGLGTFEDVNGEMIVVDHRCFRAMDDGTVAETPSDMGVPFACVAGMKDARTFRLGPVTDINTLKDLLTVKIEEGFGLNRMHIIRIDGNFPLVRARSEAPYRSQHIALKEILQKTQKDFIFKEIKGSLVCVYYPDYMDGINAPGWHLHFISEDRSRGGHVFDLEMTSGQAWLIRIGHIEIQLPSDPAFDTYSLKEVSEEEIKEVEQKS